MVNPKILNDEIIRITKNKTVIKTYQRIARLLEKMNAKLNAYANNYNYDKEQNTTKALVGISREAKQLRKLDKKWFKIENNRKNREELQQLTHS